MTTAFCPGHITCFFHPVRTEDLLTSGSRGVGIKLSKGTTVTLEERTDDRLSIIMDGREAECHITRLAIRNVDRERGFDVTVENDFPVGQGFGMSASGSVAAALCACEFNGRGLDDAFRSAHIAEIQGGGGLGDVSGIMGNSHVPVRAVAGLPPFGKVVDSGLDLNLTVAVIGGPLNTGETLSNADTAKRIQEKGSEAVTRFLASPSEEMLYSLSKEFSSSIGLETPEMSGVLSELRKGGHAGMCMLGHSIFTDLPLDEVSDAIGPDMFVASCGSTDTMPRIIRRA